MKKDIFICLTIFLFIFSIYAENKTYTYALASAKIEKKLTSMGIKNYKIKENFSKIILKLYLFNENNMNGGIALTKLDDYNVDIYILLLNQKDNAVIKTIEVIDEKSLKDKEEMNQLIEVLQNLNDKKIDKVTDAISGATKYTKKIYIKIKYAAMQIIKELESKQ